MKRIITGTFLGACFHAIVPLACGQDVPPPQFLPPPRPIEEPANLRVHTSSAALEDRMPHPLPFLASDEDGFPKQALLPDPNGTIWMRRGKKEEGTIPNPFDVRIDVERAIVETVLTFSGVAHGYVTTATVNGKAYVQGDRIAGFNIAGVSRSAMLLEKDGAFFVIPRGLNIRIKETF